MPTAQQEALQKQLAQRRAHTKAARKKRTRPKPPKAVQPTAPMREYARALKVLSKEWAAILRLIIEDIYPQLLAESRIKAAIDTLGGLVPRLDARDDLLRRFRLLMEQSRQRVYAAPTIARRVQQMTQSLSVFNRTQLNRQFRAVTGFDFPDPARSNVGRLLEQARQENIRAIVDLTRTQQDRLERTLANSSRQGIPLSDLSSQIQVELGVTERGADVIAREQTFRINADLNELRIREAGLEKYEWSTSLDERVRPDHAALEGKIFSFDDPPIIDQKTGKRGNPGTDSYGCRCNAIPYFDFLD